MSDQGWPPPAQPDEPPDPTGNGGRRSAPQKQASGWLIPVAIVIAGVMIAIAIFISRRNDTSGTGAIPSLLPVTAPSAIVPPVIASTATPGGGGDVAQQNLTAVLESAESLRQSTGSYLGATSFDLVRLNPDLTFEPATSASTGPTDISVSTSTSIFSAAALSDSGTCYWVKRVASGQTTYGTGTPCTGAAAGGAVLPAWPSTGMPSASASPSPSPT